MPIRISRHDKNTVHTQLADTIVFMIDVPSFSSASYTANIAVLGVIYRSR